MTKAELVATMSKEAKISKAAAEKALNGFTGCCHESSEERVTSSPCLALGLSRLSKGEEEKEEIPRLEKKSSFQRKKL